MVGIVIVRFRDFRMIRQSMVRLVLAVLAGCPLPAEVSLPVDRASDLLRAVSEKYESLDNYLFEGAQSANVAGSDCRVEIPFQIVQRADSPGASASAPSRAIHFTPPRTSKVCFDAISDL